MKSTEVGTRLFFTHPERDKRDTAKSAAVSSLVHLLLILAFVLLSRAGIHILTATDVGAGTGIGAGAAGGGGGGSSGEEVSLLIPEPPPEAPEEPQVTVPEKIEEVMPTIPTPELVIPKLDSVPLPTASASTSGTGSGSGSGQGPGVGPGSGGGTGGGSGGGTGSDVGPGTGKGRLIAPSPEVLIIPPPGPAKVRGKTLTVRMAIDSIGIVKNVEIIPSSGDGKYDELLKRVAMGWRFRPARDASNRAVAIVYDISVVPGGK